MKKSESSIAKLVSTQTSSFSIATKGAGPVLALGATFSAFSDLDAAIQYSGPKSIVLNANTTTSQVNYMLNFDGDGYNDVEIRQVEFGGGASQFAIGFIPNTTTRSNRMLVETANNWIDKLSSGNLIGPGGNFDFGSNYLRVSFNGTMGYGNFTGRGFGGFQFEATGGAIHYAWADMTVAANGSSIIIHGWAYEDTPNTTIAAGAIPEPAEVGMGLGLLALGAAGLRRWRKNKA
ncbi:hypothetical protein [Rubellicoccus peritrichatus]|uniref:PEP-CTERM protein-sorting domain-containing protein n=1 Tax=Rubellicoccus peritrichatus TaxID=3080537 RepID=A0AAQ3QT95_9BACT|nr:hypothetical protein [Puniceicoccus sp. CR14]WOO43463.1 hypothetical protein RZN69_10215 [Puniceicoccus sp. CR14]